MKSYTQIIRDYSRIFYRAFLFVLTAFLLQIILPGEPIFRFEYQKGAPWKHENLIAPFDFAILKTDSEIQNEKLEIAKGLAPYFKLDTTVYNDELFRFQRDFSAAFDTSLAQNKIICQELSDALSKVYKAGILERSPDSYTALTGKPVVALITGNISSNVPVSQLYSEKTSYNYLSGVKDKIIAEDPTLSGKLASLDLMKYLKSNLVFDQTTTQKQLQEAQAEISPSLGMVHAGDRIILNGEIVDAQTYKILESLKTAYEKKRGQGFNRYMIAGGKLMLVMIFLALIFIFLYFYRKDILSQLRRLTFLFLLIVALVFLSVFINKDPNLNIYLVPFAILPIFIRTFYDSRTAIFVLIISALMVGLYAPNSFEYILIQVIAGIVAVFSLARMHRRVHLVMASLWVLLAYIVSYSALNTIQEGSILNINFRMFEWFAISALLVNLAYPLIYIFEKIFGFISDVTLIEISDTNQPLLRKMAEEAPGTFQHSMQIANLAEEVVLKIGGNPFLVRAGALYHDIGKIAKADFFTENQFGIQNPHDTLNYEKSAEIIISHVKDGVKLAKKYKLPERLIEFISTHHGTTTAKYFYLKQKQDNPNDKTDENKFRYPGPLPRSKEAAVIMLVDGIEAASRSLQDKTRDNLKKLIDDMIDQKVNEHQLDNSILTFHDISTIKEIILNKLLNIYHVRIAYPKEEKKE